MKRLLLLSLVLLLLPFSALAAQEDSFTVDTISVSGLGVGSVLSPDDHTLAVYDFFVLYMDAPQPENLKIRLINTQTGMEAGSLSGATDWVIGADFTSDGSQLATFHRNGDLMLWDVASRSLIKTIQTYMIGGGPLQFLNDDQTVIFRAGEFTLGFLNTETGAITRLFGTHFDTFDEFIATSSEFPTRGDLIFAGWTVSSDGRWLATAMANDQVYLWDLDSGEKTTLREPSEQMANYGIRSLQFSSDSSQLFYYDHESEGIHIWDVNTQEEIRVLELGDWAFTVAPGNATLAWAERETGTIFLVDTAGSGAPVEVFTVGEPLRVTPNVTNLAFSSDGSQLIVAGLFSPDETSTVYVVDLDE